MPFELDLITRIFRIRGVKPGAPGLPQFIFEIMERLGKRLIMQTRLAQNVHEFQGQLFEVVDVFGGDCLKLHGAPHS